MESFVQEFTVDLPLHDTECLLTVKIREDGLGFKYEEKDTGKIWNGNFTAKYIEDITQKTGNFKKFEIFIKMLMLALKGDTESVYIDVLTAQDLEELKRKKLGSSSGPITTSTKRYLILTSNNESDKVHYPLPLSYDENPDTETLKQTIARLSFEIETYRSKTASVAFPDNISDSGKVSFYSEVPMGSNGFNATSRTVEEIKGENERLRRKLALLERTNSVQDDGLYDKLEQYKSVDRYLESSRLEMRTLSERLNDTHQKLEETRSELFKTRTELGHYEQLEGLPPPELLRAEIFRLKNQLESEKKVNSETLSRQINVLNENNKELEKAKDDDKILRAKLKELETKLEEAVKKNSYSMYGSRGSYRSNSNSSYKRYSPAQNKMQNNIRSNSLPQKRPINNRASPANSYGRRDQVSNNKYQPKYSPANRSNSGNKNAYNRPAYNSSKPGYSFGVQGNRQLPGAARKSPVTNTFNAARRSPVTNSYGAARRSPGNYGNINSQRSPATNTYGANRRSPGTNTYGVNRRSPATNTYGVNRKSPATNAYGAARRSPITNNKVSPLRVANQTRPTVPPPTYGSGSSNVFGRLYNPTGGRAANPVYGRREDEKTRLAKGSTNIDDRLKRLQNIIKAAK